MGVVVRLFGHIDRSTTPSRPGSRVLSYFKARGKKSAFIRSTAPVQALSVCRGKYIEGDGDAGLRSQRRQSGHFIRAVHRVTRFRFLS